MSLKSVLDVFKNRVSLKSVFKECRFQNTCRLICILKLKQIFFYSLSPAVAKMSLDMMETISEKNYDRLKVDPCLTADDLKQCFTRYFALFGRSLEPVIKLLRESNVAFNKRPKVIMSKSLEIFSTTVFQNERVGRHGV